MQFDTISTTDMSQKSRPSATLEPVYFGLTGPVFWRLVPMAFGLAAWFPQLSMALASLSTSLGTRYPRIETSLLQNLFVQTLGPDGFVFLGAMLSGAMAYGTWAIARATGAPRWSAAAVASLLAVAPVFGLIPSPIVYSDAAAFSALVALSLSAVIWAVRLEDSNYLMLAFVLAVLACFFRPAAGWPAIAIGVGALLATRKLEEGPWFGMASALCWSPGLVIAHRLIVGPQQPASLTKTLPTPLETLRLTTAETLVGLWASLPQLLTTLFLALPILVLGALAVAGIALMVVRGGTRRRGGIAGGFVAVLSVLGAAAFGSLEAARLLLDPIFLGLGAATGLLLPILWPRVTTWFQTRRARKA